MSDELKENESAFSKSGLVACEALCQKMKVNVIKKWNSEEGGKPPSMAIFKGR